MNNDIVRDNLDERRPSASISAQIFGYGGTDTVKIIPTEVPSPGPAQVLVRTEAAGVNPFDWKLRSGALSGFFPLELPFTLGLGLAGVVVEVGSDVRALRVGDRVMGELRQAGGAYSQYVAVDETNLCLTPHDLSSLQGAAIPAAALTAWGAMWAAGPIGPGKRILIHGASGGCGGFGVQFGVAAGAEVNGTASAANAEYVLGLGATRVLDRHKERPEEIFSDLDLVVDMVGDASVDRLWTTLSPTGALVSIADPNIAYRTPARAKGLWYNMVFDSGRLRKIASDVASGAIKSKIAEVVTIQNLPEAIERCGTGHPPGKIVALFP